MTDTPETPEQKRRRWISIGETVAILGLVISALALWNSWKSDGTEKTPIVVDNAPKVIPLALRGTVEDDGKAMRLAPAEPSHTLDGLSVSAMAPAKGTAEFGSEPILSASAIETWLPDTADTKKDSAIGLQVEARYIEAGEKRIAKQLYKVSYRWADGGLFGGKSVRLTGISRQ